MPSPRPSLLGPLAIGALVCLLSYALSHADAATAAAAPDAAASGFKYWNVADTSKAPKTLSATGLYTNLGTHTLVPEAHRYEVNTPLFSDGAHKARWILLKPGQSVAFAEMNDYWGYPDSAVFVKDFILDSIPGDTATGRLWETRLLINKKEIPDSSTMRKVDIWYGFSYRWRDNQADADWVGTKDVGVKFRTYPQGKGKPAKMKRWVFPAANCVRCHSSSDDGDAMHARSVLGFFTAQLNRPLPGNKSANQLTELFAKGVLKGSKPADWSHSPKWAAIDDTTASLNLRARSYLGANCSGCHSARGKMAGILDQCQPLYDYTTMNDSIYEYRHEPSGSYLEMDDSLPLFYPVTDKRNNPLGLDSLLIGSELVVPGYPQKSAIYMRQRARQTDPESFDPELDQMPPLGTFEVNEPALAVIAAWIRSVPAKAAPGWEGPTALAGHGRKGESAPALMGDRALRVPLDTDPGARVSMTGMDGRTMVLKSSGDHVYAVPANAPRGMYIIRIGDRSFKRALR